MKVLDKSNSITYWETPPQNLQLNENHVDVWLSSLDMDENILDKLKIILSEDELMRAQRFYSVELTKQFIAARGLLRLILARYMKVKPGELQFQYNVYRKPFLTGKFKKKGLCFNTSHSQGIALYGITQQKEIGVDIEKIRSDLSCNKIAKRQFSQSEFMLFQKSPVSKKTQTFFTLWTRKEALLKALAQGLHFSMKQFDVSGTPCRSVKFLNNSTNTENNSEWFIRDLEVDSGFCAALAIEGQHDIIKLYKASTEQLLSCRDIL